MSKWNKIEDGMPPEINKCYLAYCEGNKCQYTVYLDYNMVGNLCWYSWGSSYANLIDEYVSHWREMPKNPKE